MPMPLTVRAALPEEIPALSALIVRSARALSAGFYTASEAEAAIRHVFGVDTQLVRDGSYLVAELDGVLAGCGGWSRRRTLYGGDQRPVGGDDLLKPGQDAAKIRAFFVAPEAARRGVGRAILAACEGGAIGAGFTRFELMATLPGVPFYAALGYTAEEQVTDVLPDGTPLKFVRMTRIP